MLGRLSLVFSYFVLASIVMACSSVSAIEAGYRVALVVGNAGYSDESAALDNPANDARAISEKFRALGIEVIEAIDLDYQGMRDALRAFDRALQGADAGIFYYAGHAMEYRGRNYLLPTDTILETEGDVGLGLIEMDRVLQVMETSVPIRLVFLDACRNNPLARSFRGSLGASRAASVGRGLGRIDTAVGTFIAYATAPGDIAADGKGDNSPFTTAMLTHLEAPGLDISQLMQKVRNSVVEATNQKQIPWDSSSLRGPFILNLDITINEAPVTSSDATTGNDNQRAETVFWESVQGSTRTADFEAYLERFGEEGVFASLATNRIEALEENHAREREAILNFDRREVQEALSVSGYDTGVADGLFGPQTRRAIKAWQEENNKEVTGYISVKQANEILAAAPPKKFALATPKSPSKQQKADAASNANQYYAKAVAIYEKDCKEGNATGCTELGDAHYYGRGVKKDYLVAARFYQKGCDGGNWEGCTDLGYLHRDGIGVEKNQKKAAGLYELACNADYARGCDHLGYLYREGLGVGQNYSKAVRLFQQACDGGDGQGCENLGYVHRRGIGVDRDYSKAARFYRRSCNLGDAGGCTNLGHQYEKGRGVEQDYIKASKFYEKGCDDDYARACTDLGFLFRRGLGVEQSDEKAFDFYKQGCDGDHARGCKNLAFLYRDGIGVEQDYAKAKELYQRACDDGFAEGCEALGNLLKN